MTGQDWDRLGMSRPDRAWEVFREFNGDGPWAVYHPEVDDESMPNEGYFATWQEAMDFICEYERAKDWARDMKLEDYLNSYPEDDWELKEILRQQDEDAHRYYIADRA